MVNSLFASTLSVLLLGATALAQWQGATTDTLTNDTYRDEIALQALAIDVTNTLHAAWKRANPGGGWQIFYALKQVFGTWSAPREVVDSGSLVYEYALAVHRQAGRPFVVYERESAVPGEIFLASDSNGTWVHTRITENTTEDLSPTIAIDHSGYVHLAWIGKDSVNNWKIFYATNMSGTWETQLLHGSELGPFGSGASPFIVATSAGVAHIFYRGGDFGLYHIHHTTNAAPGGMTWQYEIVSTPNGNDFGAAAMIAAGDTLHLIASGNDGFGFPVSTYYTKKGPGGSWSSPQRANPTGNGGYGSLFIDHHGKAHITWNEISGNIIMGNLYYASNTSGAWVDAPLLADEKTWSGVVVLDNLGYGHALAVNGETWQTQEVLAIRSASPLTSVENEKDRQPLTFALEQNYPNPFNPKTVIRYALPVTSFVSLKIYNLLGQEVATLVNEEMKAGSYEVTWDATGFATGVYVYRLRAGTFSESKKLILLQ